MSSKLSAIVAKALAPVRAVFAKLLAPVRSAVAKLIPQAVKDFWGRKDVQAVWEWIKEPLYAVVVVFAFTSVVVQPFYVPSGSMEPSLAIGDAVLATKFSYGYTRYSLPFDYIFLGRAKHDPKPVLASLPTVGDVVVFRLPRDSTITYVKRVIGLPGDRIQMKNGYLWINGKELPLQYLAMDDNEDEYGGMTPTPVYIETLPNGRRHKVFKMRMDGPANNTEEFVVPPGHVFMMGDNRDNSLDSRWAADQYGVGYVPVGNLVGHAFIVIGSVDFKNAGGVWEWPLYFRLSRVLRLVR